MDGFDYLTNITPNVLDVRMEALAAMQPIRESGLFHGSFYVVPEGLPVLAALGTYTTNLIVTPNTIIYGVLAFDALNDTILTSGLSVNHFTFKIFESPGLPIIEQYVRSSFGQDYSYRGQFLTNSSFVADRQGLPYSLLEQPVQVLNSRLTVEISNPSITASVRPIVVLVCAEPKPPIADQSGRYC